MLLQATRTFAARSAVFPSATSAIVRRSVSAWANVPAGPPDPILGVTEKYKADPSPKKINLGVGAYRDGEGKPYVLPSVLKAERKLARALLDKEYLPITGLSDFTKAAAKLAYGEESAPLVEERLAITQSISGTGALRIGTAFLARFYPGAKAIYLPTPTWGNHIPIAKDSGLEVKQYKYFDKETVGLDFEGMKADIEAAPEGSIILLHACAHNPTGIDPTEEQWKELSEIMKQKQHFSFFDMAYQGFASGDIVKDAFAVRYFVEQGHQILLCQSFAKNLGLYGERVGAISFVCADKEERARVDSQLKIIIRPLYSNPPIHGARLVHTILDTPRLYKAWLVEVKGMADRIISMREKLYNKLVELDTPGEWGHIKSQIGMFSFTGLKPEQVDKLAEQASIYLTRDGRISMAALNESNVEVSPFRGPLSVFPVFPIFLFFRLYPHPRPTSDLPRRARARLDVVLISDDL
nr:aspartate aminotransferase [Naematelia aurantialba]